MRICTHSKKLEHKNYVCNFQLSVFQEKLTKTDINVNRARQMEQFIRSLLWDLVNSVSIYECFIGPFSFDISRRKCNKWYFVSKIVLTYCKKNGLVIEKKFGNWWLNASSLQKFWDQYNNLFKQWKVRTIFETECFFKMFLEVF